MEKLQLLKIYFHYHSQRWFSPWSKDYVLEKIQLPPLISAIKGQETAPFGDAIMATTDTVIGCEICQELFTPISQHTVQALQGKHFEKFSRDMFFAKADFKSFTTTLFLRISRTW